MTNTNDLKSVVKTFKGKQIAVIGDIIVDKFVWGKVSRISPEAPVPVVNVQKEELMLGGSANVINNILSLGGNVSLFGALGKDDIGTWAVEELKSKGTDIEGVLVDSKRKTSLKTRVIATKQQVVRIDNEVTDPILGNQYNGLISCFREKMSAFDAVIVSDYCKGIITPRLMTDLTDEADNFPILVDPKVNNFKHYRNVNIITPNAFEACSFAQIPNEENRESVLLAGKEIINRLGCKHLLVTRGEHGMLLFENEKDVIDIPTIAKEVSDVSGAGDTVISVLALAISSGAKLKDSAHISNIASGIVVGKLGTASVGVEELIAHL